MLYLLRPHTGPPPDKLCEQHCAASIAEILQSNDFFAEWGITFIHSHLPAARSLDESKDGLVAQLQNLGQALFRRLEVLIILIAQFHELAGVDSDQVRLDSSCERFRVMSGAAEVHGEGELCQCVDVEIFEVLK